MLLEVCWDRSYRALELILKVGKNEKKKPGYGQCIVFDL